MEFIISLASDSLGKVWGTFLHNWPFLAASVIIAGMLKAVLDLAIISTFLKRYCRSGVFGATLVAVATPLCSCGTMAIILGMMANTMPWAPIIAFMVASPLTSPQELVYSAGLFGWPFAMAFFISSILLGLAGGWIAGIVESRVWLKNQTRFTSAVQEPAERKESSKQDAAQVSTPAVSEHPSRGNGVGSPFIPLRVSVVPVAAGCGCAPAVVQPVAEGCGCALAVNEPRPVCSADKNRLSAGKTSRFAAIRDRFTSELREMWTVTRQLVPLFFLFAFVGYFINGLIPASWVASILGEGNIYSVPFAATLGLPLYINSEASLPLVRALIDGGMSQGAALAFLITGAGTSIGAVAGALTIARWRVLGIVVGTLWLGAAIAGYAYNFLLTLRLL